MNNVDPKGNSSTKYIGEAFRAFLNNIKKSIKKFLKDYVGYIKGSYLYISNSLIANIIDSIIYASSNAITAAVKSASIKTILKNIKIYLRNNYDKAAKFFKENLFGKILEKVLPDAFEFTTKAVAKIWAKKVVFKFAKNVIIDRATKNFTVYRMLSNFTSVGSIIALLFDVLDGNPNGYMTIKVR